MLTVLCRVLMAEGDFQNAIYTSPQRSLVHQLSSDKRLDITPLLGRGNYPCEKSKSGFAGECPIPPKLRRKICSDCSYLLQKDKFLRADIGVTTLDKILTDKSIPAPSILVIDESQGTEEKLLNHSEIEIPDEVDLSNMVETTTAWITRIRMEILKVETKMEAAFERNMNSELKGFMKEVDTTKMAKELVRYDRILTKARGVLRMAETDPSSYIITEDRNFRMMSGRKQFQDLIMNTKLVVLASGTPNTQLLAPPGYASVTAPHPIPQEQRMIYFQPCGKMNLQNREATLDKIGPIIANLHKAHGQNTLVHAHSYKLADTLGSILYDEGCRPMFTGKDSREADVEKWKAETGRILVSVGMEEGLDLPGPRNCLNIIAKVPFQYLGDEWIVHRNELDKSFPIAQRYSEVATVTAVQQACGRMVRGPNDLGPGGKPKECYILDSSFEGLYKRCWSIFQPWFRECLRRKT
jgi:Rad3-related DNA helicase